MEEITQQAPTLIGVAIGALTLAYAVVKKWPEHFVSKREGDESNESRDKLRQAFRDDIEELRADIRNLYTMHNASREEATRAAGRLIRIEQKMDELESQVENTGKIVLKADWRLVRVERILRESESGGGD